MNTPFATTSARSARVRYGVALCAFSLIYLTLSLPNLNRSPPVHEDEPYIAAAAQSLAETGIYGNPLFAGFYGAERHVFLHPPLLPFVQAGTFRLFGVSLESARAPGIVAGLAVLGLAMALGARLGGFACACTAAVLLLAFPLTSRWYGTSGVPLLDIARIARQDILVPVFGMSALLVFNRATAHPGSPRLWFLCGALVGCATLAHIYGAFYGVAFTLVLLARSGTEAGRGRAILLVIAGAALVLAPLVPWLLANLPDFLGQQRLLVTRYRVLDPRFLLHNVLTEPERYRRLLPKDISFTGLLLHPGLWMGGLLGLHALVSLAQKYWQQRRSLQFALLITLATHVVLFTVLVQAKSYNYIIAFWPLATLVLATALVDTWQSGTRRTRTLLAVTLTAALAEGTMATVAWQRDARRVTPYDDFTGQIGARMEPGARVLGLQQYWLGLRQFDYTSWLLPVWLTDPRFIDEPVPLDVALERVAPDYILIDRNMASYFETLADRAHPDHARLLRWRDFSRRHNATLTATVNDSTYGEMQIYRVR
jgi:4-amino-4-deoxy-L-arabinose transferase-like glycosyltransferase